MRRTIKKSTLKPYRKWKSSKGVAEGYRSGLEKINQEFLKANGIPYGYESRKIPFTEPSKNRKYTPDFFLDNGIIVEAKGRFLSKDRRKHLLIRDQHPILEIRFVFSRANAPIYKGSKTTNAKWAEKHGFLWAEKLIPIEWALESANRNWLDAIQGLAG